MFDIPAFQEAVLATLTKTYKVHGGTETGCAISSCRAMLKDEGIVVPESKFSIMLVAADFSIVDATTSNGKFCRIVTI